MTADEYIASIPGFADLSLPVQCDLLAYYLINEAGAGVVTGTSISSLRSALHLAPYARVAAYLSEQAVKRRGKPAPRYVKQKTGYVLERSYSETLKRDYLGRPMTKNLAAGLRSTLGATKDPAVAAYLDEAVSGFELNLLRSALIMSWCVAYGLFRAWLFRNHLAALNAEMFTWKSPKSIAALDDFQELTEATVIDTARRAKLISKEQHKLLKHLLDERNSFAHPTSRSITPATVEAYIDSVVRDVIPAYG